MSLTLAAGFAITEPIKLGYHAYLACAKSLSKICDEVIIICGRKEQESEDLLLQIPRVKVINTDSWPVDYDYNHMRDHFQAIFDHAESDVVLKMDSDCVFHDNYTEIRSAILNAAYNNHCTYIGRINYVGAGRFSINYNSVLYAVNKKMLEYDGIDFCISNDTGSNKPSFKGGSIDTCHIKRPEIYPINYDCTFMTAEQIAYKWASWHNAVFKTLGKLRTFDSNQEAINEFVRYHCDSNKHINAKDLSAEGLHVHPVYVHDLITGLQPNQWGYINFNGEIPNIGD